jgi:hypothetical protein
MSCFCSLFVKVNSSSSVANDNSVAFNKLQSMVNKSGLRRGAALRRYNDQRRIANEKKKYIANFYLTLRRMSKNS